jgi:hypothetical protein
MISSWFIEVLELRFLLRASRPNKTEIGQIRNRTGKQKTHKSTSKAITVFRVNRSRMGWSKQEIILVGSVMVAFAFRQLFGDQVQT